MFVTCRCWTVGPLEDPNDMTFTMTLKSCCEAAHTCSNYQNCNAGWRSAFHIVSERLAFGVVVCPPQQVMIIIIFNRWLGSIVRSVFGLQSWIEMRQK
jgi:hypothetical protein